MAQGQETAKCHGAEGADHEQSTVGEVNHPQGAEDERQTKGNQRIRRTLVEAV
ncbi:hypothetical protein Z948_366 [Sulfitobacter donghicola DSW-25 = KCTC 12864 = JCM 14565]|nr:hypothetical protein Z948_366 [Sulfitobacter donghicola DSW-25 = KCTC 12864 = JCM 14565]